MGRGFALVTGPRVVILMGCHNGELFLKEQLESILAQTFRNWVLVVADDGSTDRTWPILEGFAERVGPNRVSLRPGPGQGFVANFLGLACDPVQLGDYYAFCDQDDIWAPRKLENALRRLTGEQPSGPLLYCSRTRLIDAHGRPVGFSPLFRRRPGFRNALVQSIAGGNTMVFNEAARQLLLAGGAQVRVASHDWWLYMLTTGAGGRVFYDPWPSVFYRQHGRNQIGGNVGWLSRWRRLSAMMSGCHREWNTMHSVALSRVEELILPENRGVLEGFRQARDGNILKRMRGLRRARLYRQTVPGTMSLLVALLTGRF